jgi:hypothetical protein
MRVDRRTSSTRPTRPPKSLSRNAPLVDSPAGGASSCGQEFSSTARGTLPHSSARPGVPISATGGTVGSRQFRPDSSERLPLNPCKTVDDSSVLLLVGPRRSGRASETLS